MVSKLKGKTVLITGASKGIGQATAIELSKRGANLILTYNTDKKGVQETADACRKTDFGNAKYFQLDVSDDGSIKSLVNNVRDMVGEIDILINNAGVIAWKEFDKHNKTEIDKQIDINLKGLIKMTHEFQEDIEKNEGMVINISSGAGKNAYSSLSVYCATKFGVRGFTQALDKELSREQAIVVNPGTTKTQMTNFSGTPVEKVASVITDAAEGKIKPDSKRDIDVWKFV